jgi:hypothetical protein
MLNDKVPDGLPEDFDKDKPKSEEDKFKDDDIKEEELLVVKKSVMLKIQEEAQKLIDLNEGLLNQNKSLVDTVDALMGEFKKIVACLEKTTDATLVVNAGYNEALERNYALASLVVQLRDALEAKINYQYLKYFLCVVCGSLVTSIMAMVLKLL